MNNNNIEGKVVVITGASSGLGESTARLLSA
jgi:NADP-dependent 3-hydroxy acid dehydrogenase YdfG